MVSFVGEIKKARILVDSRPLASSSYSMLSRQEPAGVWGGELFEDGQVIAKKRKAGRPSLSEVAAREEEAA